MGTPIHSVDTGFWKSIDTEGKAWALGLLCSDGGLLHRERIGKLEGWYVQSTDLDAVESVKRLCRYEGPINVRRFPENKTQYRLTVNRQSMAVDLAAIGVLHDKSRMTWVGGKLDSQLLRHFCRGLFDGDGSVYQYLNWGARSLVVAHTDGSKLFVEGLERVWGEVLNRRITLIKNVGASWYIKVTGNDAKRLLNWFYEGSTVSMARKRLAAQELMKIPTFTRSEATVRAWKTRRDNKCGTANN